MFGVKGDGSNEGELLQKVFDIGDDVVFEGSRKVYATDRKLTVSRDRQYINFNGADLRMANGISLGNVPILELAADFVRIDNITVTGSSTNTSSGISQAGFRTVVDNFYMGGVFQGNAVTHSGLESSTRFGRIRGALQWGIFIDSFDSNLLDIYVENNGAGGVRAVNHGSIVASNVHAFHNRIGFHLQGAGFLQFTSCYADSNTYKGFIIHDTQSSSFVDCWGFKSGELESGGDWEIIGTSSRNSFINCKASSNLSPVSSTSDWLLSSNYNSYIGCKASRIGNYNQNAYIINGFDDFQQYNQVKGINTGDETAQTIGVKYDLRNDWLKSAITPSIADGMYTITFPELVNRRPVKVSKNNIQYRPVKTVNLTNGQVYYDSSSGSLSFLDPVYTNDIIQVDSLPVSVIERPYIGDNFTRPDGDINGSAASDGEVERTWSVTSSDGLGEWSISANRAKATAGLNTALMLTEGRQDGYIEALATTVKTSGTSVDRYMAIVFRVQDISNLFILSYTTTAYWVLRKNVAGSTTVLASITAVPAVSGDQIRISFYGNKINVYINNILRASVADSDLLANTKFGFAGRGDTDSSSTWGDIRFYQTEVSPLPEPAYISVANTTDVVTKASLNTNYPAVSYPVGTVISYFNQGMEYRRVDATNWTSKAITLMT
jgi:hypothetical protein